MHVIYMQHLLILFIFIGFSIIMFLSLLFSLSPSLVFTYNLNSQSYLDL